MCRCLNFYALLIACALAAGASAHEIDAAGAAFLAELTDAERAEARWPFADAERTDIHYAPLGLDGLRHGELDDSARNAGERLLASVLSDAGVRRVRQVRELEAVVHAQSNLALRMLGLFDPGRYFWAVFGEPAAAAPWAFRFEGHHLSLNVTVTRDGIATTPLFIGAQPRVVAEDLDVGPPAGTAVLGEEERLARALYASLDDAQRARATLTYQDDRGLTIGQVPRVAPAEPLGVARNDLAPAQRALLDALLDGLAGLWREPLAAARRQDIAAARDALHFAFVATESPPRGFYLRISSPSLLLEIDNTEGGDHVHAVWHQTGADFGDDLLARHLAADHGRRLVRR
ncbi:MAG: DUF3500 domain-containing protein [Pseudomonadales bacterium]